jgi:hypothetical protein
MKARSIIDARSTLHFGAVSGNSSGHAVAAAAFDNSNDWGQADGEAIRQPETRRVKCWLWQ